MASLTFFRSADSRGHRRELSLESLETRMVLAAAPFSSLPDLVAASDSGSSATDNKTNITTPTFTGTARNAVSVKVFVSGTEAGTAPVVAGKWSFTHPGFADGRYSVSAQPLGAGGAAGARSAALAVEIRTAAPARPLVGIQQPGVTPAAAGAAATALARPTFNGTGPRGGAVEVFVDDAAVGRSTVGAGNRFVVRPTAALADGQRAVTAVAIDLFGNRSDAATLALTVDTVAPTIEAFARVSFDTVVVRFNEPVKGITPASFRFAGTTSDGLQISSRPLTDQRLQTVTGAISGQLSPDGRTYAVKATNLDLVAGTFSLTLPRNAATDLAGNRLADARTLTLTIAGG